MGRNCDVAHNIAGVPTVYNYSGQDSTVGQLQSLNLTALGTAHTSATPH